MLKVFISGLDKGTGKTIVTAGLAATMQSLSYSTHVYKPIQTGTQVLDDSHDLSTIKSIDSNISVASTYLISGASAPFVSAYEDNIKLDLTAINDECLRVETLYDCTILEGANSISTPIVQSVTELDLVISLNLPLVLVVNPTKTSIEDVITGLNYIKASRVNFSGIIINQHNEYSQNLEEKYFPQIIKEFTDVEILGIIPDFGDIKGITPEILIENTLTRINIEKIFGLQIAKLHQI